MRAADVNVTDDIARAGELAAESQSQAERIEELIAAGQWLAAEAQVALSCYSRRVLPELAKRVARWDAALRKYREASNG